MIQRSPGFLRGFFVLHEPVREIIFEQHPDHIVGSEAMAKPNYQFQKRQKELEKKKKNEEKLQRKRAKNAQETEEDPNLSPSGEGEPGEA